MKKNTNGNDKTKTVEIYYWSKLSDDEKLAGGDIRAMQVIPAMMRLSKRNTLLLLPEKLIPKGFLAKHQSVSKIFLVFLVPIFVMRGCEKQKKRLRFIYCSTCYAWDTLPAIFIKVFYGARIVCVSHDTPKQLSGYSFFRNSENFPIAKSMLFTIIGKFQNFLLRFVDMPVAMSDFALEFFQDPKVRSRAIKSSSTVYTVLSEEQLNNHRAFDIVILGRIIPRKNVQKIIKAFQNRSYKRKLKLLVITNSPEASVENEVLRYVDFTLIDVTVKLNVNEEEKQELLKQTKLYINISSDENFSTAALEAASMGTALILSDHDFFRNIYGQAAIYINENDSDELWNQVCNMLDDEQKLRKYSEKAIRIAGHYLYNDVARYDYDQINDVVRTNERPV